MTASILQEAGIQRVYLVTHAWHMRRALLAFHRFGITATPAPVRPDPWPDWTLAILIRSRALLPGSVVITRYMSEIGLAYYYIRG